jgi:hypothetical protein
VILVLILHAEPLTSFAEQIAAALEKHIEPGDILLIPNQGAYTYSFRQHFIKALPKVVYLFKYENTKFMTT